MSTQDTTTHIFSIDYNRFIRAVAESRVQYGSVFREVYLLSPKHLFPHIFDMSGLCLSNYTELECKTQ